MSSNRKRKKSKPQKVQHLPPEPATVCANCGRTVHFKVQQTRPVAVDPRRCYGYLTCPFCGQRATQLRWRRRF